MGKRYTIADQLADRIKPEDGDIVECALTTPDGQKIVWLQAVDDGGTCLCDGCFGDIDFSTDPGEVETYCTDLPGGCNVHNTIYKPACDESLVMVTLHKLEGT
jgi:hypothetical protein